MKRNQIKQFIVIAVMACWCSSTFAQQTNTFYFMEGVEERSMYNPAFQSPYNLYINLPIMPNIHFGLGNNSLVLDDIIFSKRINGVDSTITFLHPQALSKRDDFYKALQKTTHISEDFSYNLLGAGLRKGKNFFTVNIALKERADVYLPKDFFSMALYGASKPTFDLNKFGVNASVYTEIGFGYSRQLDERLTVGAKVKYLIGIANISTDIQKFEINTGIDRWNVNGSGKLNASLPAIVNTRKLFTQDPDDSRREVVDFDHIGDAILDDFGFGDLKIADFLSNYGFGIDLGVTYKVLPQLQVSAAIIDLGFISWNNNIANASISKDYTFEGIEYLVGENGDDISDKLKAEGDKLKGIFANANAPGEEGKSYTTLLPTRLNVGAEYELLKQKIGLGLLSSTLYLNETLFTDLTASVNYRPLKWLQPSLSYSVLDGRFHSVGLGAQIKLGIVNMYMAVDKIPVGPKSLTSDYYIPKYMTGTNIQAGMVLVFR